MLHRFSAAGARFRLLSERALARIGLGDNAFLGVVAFVIGIVTAAAAVGFHELIDLIRGGLFARSGAAFLYGPGLWLLVVIPAAGGLAVAFISRYVFREREGHGMVDVLESVMRSGGVIRPRSAVEKILTSAITIGTGGSAAGISAIFNSPIGGLLFTLEVILRDVTVSANTTAVFNTTQHLTRLAVTGTARLPAGGNKVLVTGALVFTGSGKLDLADNAMIINYGAAASPLGGWNGSAYSGIVGNIATGRNGGAWNGNGLHTSALHAANGLTTLAATEASLFLGLTDAATALWEGQTVSATSVLVKYTYAGDADFDGDIDSDDYFAIDSNYHVVAPPSYAIGDFNYDGLRNSDDYFAIDGNFNNQILGTL